MTTLRGDKGGSQPLPNPIMSLDLRAASIALGPIQGVIREGATSPTLGTAFVRNGSAPVMMVETKFTCRIRPTTGAHISIKSEFLVHGDLNSSVHATLVL